MTALVLYPMAVGLMLVGAGLAWPVARRVGERQPDRLYWAPVSNPHDSGRRWRAVVPNRRGPRARLAGWWASTTPRDVHTQVRAALLGRTGQPGWMDAPHRFMGQPPRTGRHA